MRRVRLYVHAPFTSGTFVVELDIPPFLNGPDVLIWGSRTFKQAAQPDEYVECFTFWIPMEKTDG